MVDAIIAIKRENLRYSAGHIARMIFGGKIKFRISKKTVATILQNLMTLVPLILKGPSAGIC